MEEKEKKNLKKQGKGGFRKKLTSLSSFRPLSLSLSFGHFILVKNEIKSVFDFMVEIMRIDFDCNQT